MKQKIINKIGIIKTDFSDKFGIPRQSGRSNAKGTVILEKEYSNPDYIREIEGFSHIWLIFGFSLNEGKELSPLVRPPRLGGNKKVGVFASRSPFRPNGLGLSVVKLLGHEYINGQIKLNVSGVDILDGTPIYDIKPYIPSSDCVSNAFGGYSEEFTNYKLKVKFNDNLKEKFSEDKLATLIECLSDDPRPSYQKDDREYGMIFDNKNIKFKISGDTLTITDIEDK